MLKTLYAYVSQEKKMLEENQGISMFGTTSFHVIWERACSEVFGNKLNVAIGNIQMKEPLNALYDKKTKLIDMIEKPKWCGDGFCHESKETLIPDLITINCVDGQDWFIIFDAKYYLIQLEKDRVLRGTPGVGDIIKQYMYQLAYKDFLSNQKISIVKNCFLMPTEEKTIIPKGTAKLNMISDIGLEDIQIRLIPADKLFDCYLSKKRISIDALQL